MKPKRLRAEWISGLESFARRDHRRAAVEIHSYLRKHILSGRIPPNSILSQLKLADLLKVSRTPIREAIRMLQDEGLVRADPNRRPRVTGFDPWELDALYASRIGLECIAVAISVPRVNEDDLRRLDDAVKRMRSDACRRDVTLWSKEHRACHALLVSYASKPMQQMLSACAERSRRYLFLYQHSHQPFWWHRGEVEHAEIAAACRSREVGTVVRLTARHLARTAIDLMAKLAPEVEPAGTRCAVRLVCSARWDREQDRSPRRTIARASRGAR